MTTGFDSLAPQVRKRIITTIATTASRRRLPLYATVSKEWQNVVEKVTFAELYLTDGRVNQMADVVTRRRQSFLQYIVCHVMLVPYADHGHRETNSQARQSNQVLHDYIIKLFKIMASWRPEDAPSTGTKLTIVINSPSDESSSRILGEGSQNKRARTALAQLDVPSEALPKLPTISGFANTGRHLELASVTLLVSKMPNLRSLDVVLEHDTRDPKDLQQRLDFITTVGRFTPNVTSLSLHRPLYHVDSNKSPSQKERTVFHTSLRNYTQRCSTVTFDDCVYAREFFAPFSEGYDEEEQTTSGRRRQQRLAQTDSESHSHERTQPNVRGPHDLWWPYLRKLRIRNSYMLRRPYTRVANRAAALNLIHEVILFAGRAVGHMPGVDYVRIKQYILSEGRLETIDLEYQVESIREDGRKGGPKLVIDGFRPSVPALEAWTESVRATRGVHLRVAIDGGTSQAESESDVSM